MMQPTVFFDLDGVLADFVRGAMAYHRKYIPIGDVRWDFPPQLGFDSENDPAFWNPLGEIFWKNLGILYDGMQVLYKLREIFPVHNIGVISSPCRTYGCDAGKRYWVEMNLPSDMRRNVFIGNNKHLIAGPGKLLIDDSDENIDKWIKAGGWGILAPRPWNRERQHTDFAGMFDAERMFNLVVSSLEVMRGTSVQG